MQARFAVAVPTSRNSLDECIFEIRHANRTAGFSSCIGTEMVSELLETLQMSVGNERGNGKQERVQNESRDRGLEWIQHLKES